MDALMGQSQAPSKPEDITKLKEMLDDSLNSGFDRQSCTRVFFK